MLLQKVKNMFSVIPILRTERLILRQMRVSDANAWGADYYVSIHANTSSRPEVSGSEAFSYSAPSVAFSLGTDILEGLNEATGLRNRGTSRCNWLLLCRRLPGSNGGCL